jgi:hypothetical protein
VEKIGIAFHAANAALVAVVVISLNAIIKEVAHGAKIRGELDATLSVAACLRHGLPFIARSAHHFFDGVAVHLVCFGIVVAMAAPMFLVTTRGDQAASAHVVFTHG